jgi:3-methylcrotonyl-CoA carboxylase alpha subunit
VEIQRLLVANRGEIAVRILRTCRRLAIETVAVAAPDDGGAFHTRQAGETVAIASYLDPTEIVRAAREADADAVHPGYGFLAENAELAESVASAGLGWVGPPPDVLRASGDKLAAKRTAEEAGVPVVPVGSPAEVGFPLMIKAAAGGGGRGMRVVRSGEVLDEALASARREAKAGFGDDTVFFERYVERPRHVEIQLLADAHGTVVHLGERDCSLQRRHQKVIEESPSSALDEHVRAEMGAAAVRIGEALGYVGAGTAEFLLGENGEFWFLELNARIQVEHPVTELVTGLDLVEEQLQVASGERLRDLVTRCHKVGPAGHAIEARLYAEHPVTFLPQAGRVERLRLPDGVRVDQGVEAGDEVPVAYDPLLAKLVAHGETREEALERLEEALAETDVGGIVTNLAFLRWAVRHPELRAGRVTTAFLAEHPPLSRPLTAPRGWNDGFRMNLPAAPPGRPPTVEEAAHTAPAGGGAGGAVVAPMPGIVIRVLAREGARVVAREPLLVLEAMKMETPLVAPYDALVRRVLVGEGDQVAGGSTLVELDSAA